MLLVGLLASGCVANASPAKDAHEGARQSPSVSGRFDVGGHRLYIECRGTGTPTMVLGHGQGASRTTWDRIWPDLLKMGRVCRYDRAASGNSEVGPVPTTSGRIVRDLHKLLEAAGVPPPYVMVGHSFGGLNAQLFARTFPSEVSGLVLIESSSRDYDVRRSVQGAMPEDPTERQLLLEFIEVFNAMMHDYTMSPEGVDWETSYQELSGATDFGGIPLYVVTAGDRTWTSPPAFPPPLKERVARLWLDAQTKLATRSSRSTHVVAEGAGHLVHEDRPDIVIKAIKAVLEAAGSGVIGAPSPESGAVQQAAAVRRCRAPQLGTLAPPQPGERGHPSIVAHTVRLEPAW